MISVIQKRDRKFDRLNIMIDNITDVDSLAKFLRDAENGINYQRYTDNDKDLLNNLLKTCEETENTLKLSLK